MTAIEPLVALAGPAVVDRFSELRVPGVEHEHQDALASMLDIKNGFFAFDSALHVFSHGEVFSHGAGRGADRGEDRIDPGLDIKAWNAEDPWRASYGDLAEGLFFFAQDVFGSQFCLSEQGVLLWDAETGSAEVIAADLEGWARAVLDDADHLTGRPLVHDWFFGGGVLRPTERPVPRTPFVLGGEHSADNLAALDSIEGMRFRGDPAVRLRDLPDGTDVQLEFED